MKAKIFAVAVVMLFAFGCGHPAGQIAAGYGGELAADILKSALRSKPTEKIEFRLMEGREIEKYQIGNYDVRIYEAKLPNSPDYTHILFVAKGVTNRRIYIKRLAFDKIRQTKEIDNFNQLDETKKKQQIRDWYLKYKNSDLGPNPA